MKELNSFSLVTELIGRTLTEIQVVEDEHVTFTTHLNERCLFGSPGQECCEVVFLKSVSGNPQSLVGTPITNIIEEEVPVEEYIDTVHATTTFVTAHGSVAFTFEEFSTPCYIGVAELHLI